MLSISIVHDDILSRDCDVLILKHANGFYGVDAMVAKHLNFSANVPAQDFRLLAGARPLRAKKVLFLGVGPLSNFRYRQIREFGRAGLTLAVNLVESPATISMTMHGVGYGLDEAEAFLSLAGGILDAVSLLPDTVRTVEIVDNNAARAKRLRHLLSKALEENPDQVARTGSVSISTKRARRTSNETSAVDQQKAKAGLADYGSASERKTKLFVAMPFSDEWSDEYDIAMIDAAQHVNVICERIDKEAYVGNIMDQVRNRISSYQGMMALLNGANPNVFLEVGYAWAKEKPILLIVKDGQKLPFDLSGQKCIKYKKIADLREKLKVELKGLLENGVFAGGT